MNTVAQSKTPYKGNDRLLFGIIMGVVAFWLFAQTTLNIAPDMGRDCLARREVIAERPD